LNEKIYRSERKLSIGVNLVGPGIAQLVIDYNFLKFLNFGIGYDFGWLIAGKLPNPTFDNSKSDFLFLGFDISSKIYLGDDPSSSFFLSPAASFLLISETKSGYHRDDFIIRSGNLFVGYEFRKVFLFRIYGGIQIQHIFPLVWLMEFAPSIGIAFGIAL